LHLEFAIYPKLTSLPQHHFKTSQPRKKEVSAHATRFAAVALRAVTISRIANNTGLYIGQSLPPQVLAHFTGPAKASTIVGARRNHLVLW